MMFRKRRGSGSPPGTGVPIAVSVLDPGPVAPLEAPLPGRRFANGRLPDIVMPSTAKLLAGRAAGPTRIVAMYSTILGERSDVALFVGVNRRAAILLRLTSNQRKDLYRLDDALREHGAQLYVQGHQFGRYGMLRVVLRLPDTEPGLFGSYLSLAHGDVQEFVAAAHANDCIELHVFHATDDRMLSSTCSGPAIHRVFRDAVDAIVDFEHPATVAEQREPLAGLAERFPQIGDDLSGASMIRLRVTGPAQPFVLFACR
jgi:hypothetical protein